MDESLTRAKGQLTGLVGLGNIGRSVARRLVGAGLKVVVYDRDPARVDEVVTIGGVAASDATELAAGVDVVLTALPHSAAVEDALLGPAGVVAGLRRGTALIDFSTNPLALARRIGAECLARGIEVLDAPMTQARGDVSEGRAVIMVGGDPAVVARWRPLLSLLAMEVIETGRHGSGTVVKLVTQYMGLANIVSSIEGFLIAAAAGADLRAVRAALQQGAGDSQAAGVVWELARTRPFERPGSADGTLGLLSKDIGQVLQLAEELGVSHQIGAGVEHVFSDAAKAGLGGEHFSAIVGVLEDASRTRLSIPT